MAEWCTVTLIGARIALTVGHCVAHTVPQPSETGDGQNPLDLWVTQYASSNVYTRTWKWEADFAWWSGTDWGASLFPFGVPTETGQGAGRLWVHGNTRAGMDLAPQYAAHGIHGVPGDPGLPQGGLANAVQDVSPSVTRARSYIKKLLYKLPLDVMLTARPCLTCGIGSGLTGQPELEHPDWGYPLAQVPEGSPLEAQRLIAAPTLGIQAGLLLADGTIADLSDTLGDGLKQSLALGLTWVNAVESEPAAGVGAVAPSALGLSNGGTMIAERAYHLSGSMLGQEDLSPTHGPLRSAAMPLQSTASAAPQPRQAFEAVYSRSTRQLFIVGGEAPTTHELIGDIWYTGVSSENWHKVPLMGGHSVGKLLATTFSLMDGRRWILDQTTEGKATYARLAVVTPGTGEVKLLGTWKRLNQFDKHWLLLDRDGAVLFAASSSKVNKHVLVRINDNHGEMKADWSYAGVRSLALPPLVDGAGYAFTLETATSKMPVTVRRNTHPLPARRHPGALIPRPLQLLARFP